MLIRWRFVFWIMTALTLRQAQADALLDIMNSYQGVENNSTCWTESEPSEDEIEIKYLNKWEGVEVVPDPYGDDYEEETF